MLYTWALAVRHIEVIPHYLHPLDMATIVAAGIGVGGAVAWARERLAVRVPRFRGSVGVAIVVVASAVLAVASSRPFTPLNASARSGAGLEGRLDARAAALEPAIKSALPARAALTVSAVGPMGSPDPASVVLFIPRHRLPRTAVDLDLPLTRIAVLVPAQVDLAAGYPPVDSVVYLDGLIDASSVGPETAVLRVSSPTTVGTVEVVPILVDPLNRLWVVAIRRAP
jgi:hypothetical protein